LQTKFLVPRYPYCLGLLFQTKFQTRAAYLSVVGFFFFSFPGG
jgi:hypothetical protein